ncbi:MAG: AraC family transcriptional regulator [Alphaproteobacteria bacterium]
MKVNASDPGPKPLLERNRIFACSDGEELHDFLNKKNFRLEHRSRNNGAFDVRINGIYSPNMFLGYLQYGAPVAIRAQGRDEYWLQIPTHGNIQISAGKHNVLCTPENAAIASPTHLDYYLVNTTEATGGIRVCLYKSAIVDCLTALLGDIPSKPLVFGTELDLQEGHGRSLAQYIHLAIRDLERPDGVFQSPLVMTAFQQFVTTALLTAQPHNYSAALQRLEVGLAPRDVKRVLDYIQAHFDRPVAISDIVEATGVPGRTLFKQFRDHQGMSPMQYLRNVRFDYARKLLQAAEPGASVTEIAMEAGFMHMGRFAAEYRYRYGESPSETLRRRWNRYGR